ncbi:MAG: TRAP transporter permease [Clostridia bacterium]|jgi:TRAP transporter 4TM/12TM fusion protein
MDNELVLKYKKTIVAVIATAFALYHFFTGYFGMPGLWKHRAIHLLGVLLLVYLTTGWTKQEKGFNKISVIFNVLAIVAILCMVFYIIPNAMEIQLRQGSPLIYDILAYAVIVVLILEAVRRMLGIPLTCVVIFMLLYLYFGNLIPGALGHPKFSTSIIISNMYSSLRGILGSPIGVASTYIIMFVIFAAFLNKSGGGEFFSDLATSLTGKKIGGPAKTAVIASAFMGMINGSPVANVAGTGAFTIPLMKKMGYDADFAGGVEAAASVGGQVLPPVMGASVFLMAEITNTPYIEICYRALVPAVLYYLVVYLSVHIEAIKRDLRPMESQSKKRAREVFKEGYYYVISLIVLLGSLIMGFSPMKAAFYAIISLIVLSWFKPSTRMGIKEIIEGFEAGGRTCLVVSVACAAAGIIVAVVSVTGLGLKFASLVSWIASGNLFIALVLTAMASMILGMGVNAVASYIIIAILLTPVLTKIGLPILVSHLFCYFFSMTAGLTPPVATVSYTAAGISGGSQTRTALMGLQLGITGFIIPFVFAYEEGLLLYGPFIHNIVPILTALVGLVLITCGFRGWLLVELRKAERLLLLIGGLLLVTPEPFTDIIGLALGLVIFIYKRRAVNSSNAIKTTDA